MAPYLPLVLLDLLLLDPLGVSRDQEERRSPFGHLISRPFRALLVLAAPSSSAMTQLIFRSRVSGAAPVEVSTHVQDHHLASVPDESSVALCLTPSPVMHHLNICESMQGQQERQCPSAANRAEVDLSLSFTALPIVFSCNAYTQLSEKLTYSGSADIQCNLIARKHTWELTLAKKRVFETSSVTLTEEYLYSLWHRKP